MDTLEPIRATAVSLVAATMLLVLGAACTDDETDGGPVRFPEGVDPATVCAGVDYPKSTGRGSLTVTEEEKQEALRIMLNDPMAAEILEGLSYSVRGPGVWTEQGMRIGAWAMLYLPDPATVEGNWLKIGTGGTDPCPYFPFVWPGEARDFDSIEVGVDLELRKLVNFYPHFEEEGEFVPSSSLRPNQ